MNWLKYFSDNRIVLFYLTTACLVAVFGGSAMAVDKVPADRLHPARYSMIGLRLGVWADQGGGIIDDFDPSETVTADLPENGFYTEFFYDHRFTPALMMEASVGVASRGDAVITRGDDQYIGTLNLYSLLVQVKVSPLAGILRKVHPFVIGGGGLMVGKHNADFIRSVDPFYDYYFAEKSETDFIGVIGGGVDLAVSEQIGLNAAVKYHPVKFGDRLAGVEDYSGIAFSVGVAYFLHKK